MVEIVRVYIVNKWLYSDKRWVILLILLTVFLGADLPITLYGFMLRKDIYI